MEKEIVSSLTGRKRAGNCLACGNCCRVTDWKEDLESDRTLQMMKQFGNDTVMILKLLMYNQCSHLTKDNICTVFENRPEYCRDYPTNEWEREYHDCKGYNFVIDEKILIQKLHEVVVNKKLTKEDADKLDELIGWNSKI